MEENLISGKSLKQWIIEFPILSQVTSLKEVMWINPNYSDNDGALSKISLNSDDVEDADKMLRRFAPYISKAFPETLKENGIIESPLVEIPDMKKYLEEISYNKLDGRLLLKCDNMLPISGSIKARGGIYEVLKHAEDLALSHNIITKESDYSILCSNQVKDFYSKYSLAVGSTGNLGLSIGIMGAKLGFKVTVHMSSDAKKWKKSLLLSKGVNVIEYKSDYSSAVEEGRKLAEKDPYCYFIDDENSEDLFLGYATAAERLKKQLEAMSFVIDDDHQLFVYIPCGVGGGPGGAAFGLKLLYRDNVHLFFAEPTHSPCMLIGSVTGKHNKVCVQDFGLDNKTLADGLAVGRPSGFVGKTMGSLLSGIYTVEDSLLFKLLSKTIDLENIYLEPSAAAGLPGIMKLFNTKSGQAYIDKHNLNAKMRNAVHIAWATGGGMVPKDEMNNYYKIGE